MAKNHEISHEKQLDLRKLKMKMTSLWCRNSGIFQYIRYLAYLGTISAKCLEHLATSLLSQIAKWPRQVVYVDIG